MPVDTKEPSRLTTFDNPFNPFTQFEEWNAFDQDKGYHSLAFLSRVAMDVDWLDDESISFANEAAVDEIVREDPFGLYIKVTEKSWKSPSISTKSK